MEEQEDEEEGSDEEGELRVQRRLVAAHPQLLLLLEHPGLQRCGACAACTAGPRRRKSAAQWQQGSRACLIAQSCQNQWQLQRKRQQQGGWRSANGRDSAASKHKHPAAGSQLPRSAGVAERDALRAAAAFKLLHPRWRPIFLTQAHLAEAAAALPAAAAAAAAAADHARRGGRAGQFSAKQQAKMAELLSLLRRDADVERQPSPARQPEQQAQQQEHQQQQQEEQPDSSRQHRQQAERQQAALQEAQQAQQHAPPPPPPQQAALLGHAAVSSAFRRLPGAPAAVALPADPEQQQQQQLQQLRRQLRQLPADVCLAFEAGLAAGLPPAAVAAALARYHTITAVPATAVPEAAAAAQPRRRAPRRSSSRSSDGGSASSGSGQEDDDAEEEEPAEAAAPASATRAKRQRR